MTIIAKKYEIREGKIDELQREQKNNRDKTVDRRLRALILHAQGYTGKKISEITGYNEKYLYELYKWTKKMPRSKHPKSADPEAIDVSKKLTPGSAN